MNLDALYGLVSPFSRVSWGSVAASCAGTVAHAVQRYFLDDVYELVQLMADVEFSNWEDYDFSICEVSAVSVWFFVRISRSAPPDRR